MRRLAKKILRLCALMAAGLLFLAYLVPFVSPAQFRLFAFFGTAYPWILFLNLFFLLVLALRFDRFALYIAAAIGLGWSHLTGFICVGSPAPTPSARSLIVATHNLGGLWRGERYSDALLEKSAEAYVQFLKKDGLPDVLCTQETNARFYKRVAEKVGYRHQFNLQKGTVILSKYPMSAGGDVPFGQTANSTLWANVVVGGDTIRIYSVHLQSNRVTHDTEKIAEADPRSRGAWREARRILGKVGSATGLRVTQAELLREHLLRSPYPALVCGDFNDTPHSWVYRHIGEGLQDVFKQYGRGIGVTFTGVIPFLRIDYLFATPEWKAHSCQVQNSPFSDHKLLRATLSY